MKIERYHWHHYFGGIALLLLILQLLSGIFLTLFYLPELERAYASVQMLYKELPVGAWLRDAHRWVALALFGCIVVHIARSLLRKEFLNFDRRVVWLTGGLLLLPILALSVTGFILPWEWKGYWFMEMVPNHLGAIPLVGPTIKAFLIDAFTMSRNLVAHIIVFPVLALVLIEFHILARVRKRKGRLSGYLLKHLLIALPPLLVIGVLAFALPMPTEDPDILPMPLEGRQVPVAEWLYLALLLPFLHFEGAIVPLLAIGLPLALFILLTALPYFLGPGKNLRAKPEPVTEQIVGKLARILGIGARSKALRGAVAFVAVLVLVAGVFGPLYSGVHQSPTYGCNSCHNVAMGTRMGVPPTAFKDRNVVPTLEDNRWMVEHWFYPQVVW